MHKVAAMPMLEIIIRKLQELKIHDIRVVSGPELESDKGFAKLKQELHFTSYLQSERLGTAHALKAALPVEPTNPVFVIAGDCPLIKKPTIKRLYHEFVNSKAAVMNLGFETADPNGYGRLILSGNQLLGIVEEKDATPEQKLIQKCNSGIYLIDEQHCLTLLEAIDNDNAAGEFYLTDIIKHANSKGLMVKSMMAGKNETLGVNDRAQLAKVENIMQRRLRKRAFKGGVSMVDPQSVFFAADTKLGKDVTIEPSVFFGPGVEIRDGATIRAFSHIEGTVIGENCSIGPFARTRPGTVLEKDCKVGNFVEIKQAKLGQNSKASHLSYIGDAELGGNVNVGAGTIFCNYDGYRKHHSKIGADTFIGSNSAIVAPINIGNGVIIGAGSVVTEDVEDSTLTIARARQVNYPHRADLVRRNRK